MIAQASQRIIEDYLRWLRRQLTVDVLDGAVELTTPFLDRHNDHMQVFVVKQGNSLVLSDDGYTVSELEMAGVDLTTPKREKLFEEVLRGFGVKIGGDGELFIEATADRTGQQLHMLIQAMLAVDDMFMLAKPRVASFFLEDVQQFLDAHDVRYSSRVKITGKSGYDHAIDFLIPKSRKAPERIVQAINYPDKRNIESYLFVLSDTREARGIDSKTFAVLNDSEQSVSRNVIAALEAYNVVPARWSQRDDLIGELAA